MNQNHRYFIQYMLKNGISSQEDAIKYCRYVSKGQIDDKSSFKTLIIEINREISKQYYKLECRTCEITNQAMIIWLSSKNDDISRLQNTFNALELEYFHAIMQEILNSENYRITFIVCINITSTLTASFSRDHGQNVLNKWLKGGYFINQNGIIYFGPRLILEFTSYLKTHCPNAICTLCSELVFAGQQCNYCTKTFHSYCFSRYMKNQSDCPSCHISWEESSITQEQGGHEENSAESVEDIEETECSQPLKKKRLSKTSHSSARIQVNEQNNAESMDDIEETEHSQSSREKRLPRISQISLRTQEEEVNEENIKESMEDIEEIEYSQRPKKKRRQRSHITDVESGPSTKRKVPSPCF